MEHSLYVTYYERNNETFQIYLKIFCVEMGYQILCFDFVYLCM